MTNAKTNFFAKFERSPVARPNHTTTFPHIPHCAQYDLPSPHDRLGITDAVKMPKIPRTKKFPVQDPDEAFSRYVINPWFGQNYYDVRAICKVLKLPLLRFIRDLFEALLYDRRLPRVMNPAEFNNLSVEFPEVPPMWSQDFAEIESELKRALQRLQASVGSIMRQLRDARRAEGDERKINVDLLSRKPLYTFCSVYDLLGALRRAVIPYEDVLRAMEAIGASSGHTDECNGQYYESIICPHDTGFRGCRGRTGGCNGVPRDPKYNDVTPGGRRRYGLHDSLCNNYHDEQMDLPTEPHLQCICMSKAIPEKHGAYAYPQHTSECDVEWAGVVEASLTEPPPRDSVCVCHVQGNYSM